MKQEYICPTCNKVNIKYICNVKSKLVFCNQTCKGKHYLPPLQTGNRYSLGLKRSEETKKKISLSKTGVPYKLKGVPRLNMRGANHRLWISDRTLLKKYKDSEEKRSPMYKRWRLEVLRRDNFKCRIADNNCGGRLEIHHILPWRDFVELRYEINNGITLCHAHHPRARAEEKRLIPTFQELVSVSNKPFW